MPATGKLKVSVQPLSDTSPPGRAATLTVKAPRK
jgi:hypothetical protein